MQIAEKRALAGRKANRRAYFGDGGWDKRASEELGYDFIAIGDKVQHHAQYPDFRRGKAILSRLLGAVALALMQEKYSRQRRWKEGEDVLAPRGVEGACMMKK